MSAQQTSARVTVSFGQALKMLWPYAQSKIVEQIKTVWLIVAYLVVFQLIVLAIPIADALVVAIGVGVVIIGLAFFMEGLFLGLMPLGEICGIRLPQKAGLPVILIFAFILGMGATFAEPAIAVLKAAGSSVTAWDAPLLFFMLNEGSDTLVYAVGVGVGIAVGFGMLRFLYGWSLKPFCYVLYAIIGSVSIWGYFDPNVIHLTGLAWDCGAVTTGPVTVPLVLALGIGISRVAAGGGGGAAGGFGVVTLASAFPIIAVLGLGLTLLGSVPKPGSDVEFAAVENRESALQLFKTEEAFEGYVLREGSSDARIALFGGNVDSLNTYIVSLSKNLSARKEIFGKSNEFDGWLLKNGTNEQRILVYGSEEEVRRKAEELYAKPAGGINVGELLANHGKAAIKAIIPLSLFLILTLLFVLRERMRRADEVILGLIFAVVGMGLFGIGIELGLQRLGSEIGSNLPSTFKPVEMTTQHEVIRNFDPEIVTKAISNDGGIQEVFSRKTESGYSSLPYIPENFDEKTQQYSFTPVRGPLFDGLLGIVVVILFAFMMGYSATLAEPALNALGATVEQITVGTFKKQLLMQAVAIGVGVGIALGVTKIIYNVPLIWMLVPPYLILMVLTFLSNEDFVNIGWDSAGVTTGPVTVPLVLAMGLGIGGQVGSIEGFGILSMASVCPILSVLIVGLFVTKRRQSKIDETAA
tara:strand:+ start:1248 stop:3338 length:2091 start_codon:yes stop_codon:yes gene_type:complete